MRARIIKPGFFADQELARLPIGARLLFVGLWCLADREGRLQDSARMIGGCVFPHDDDSIDEQVRLWLELLAEGGWILRYQVGTSKYIQVVNFRKHQSPNIREAASTIPPPSTEPAKEPAPRQEPRRAAMRKPAAASVALQTELCDLAHEPPKSDGTGCVEKVASGLRPRDAPPFTDVSDFAISVAQKMLSDWADGQLPRLGPPDRDLAKRLLQAHQMSLERMRDWLLDLRRRGKRPESVQSWGWFIHLASVAETSCAAAAAG
jgi:hypothetical protein